MAEATVVAAPPPLNRREFLFYIWTASIVLSMAASGGVVLWFAYPLFRAGEFGGVFKIDVAKLPAPDAAPEDHPDGRFWLVNTGSGVVALYKVCVHLGCLYKWVPSNSRFECPCHGSKYQRDGAWIEGPAPRSLDRFVIDAVDASGKALASTQTGDPNSDPAAGGPLAIPDGAVGLQINTGDKVRGVNHA
jgi:cytochrome b6-f complex iron-sulfur subunit